MTEKMMPVLTTQILRKADLAQLYLQNLSLSGKIARMEKEFDEMVEKLRALLLQRAAGTSEPNASVSFDGEAEALQLTAVRLLRLTIDCDLPPDLTLKARDLANQLLGRSTYLINAK